VRFLPLCLSVCKIFYLRVSMHFWHYTMCMSILCVCVRPRAWMNRKMRAHAHPRALAIYSNIRLLILNKVLNSLLFLLLPSPPLSLFLSLSPYYLILFNCFSLILHFNPRAAMCYFNNDLTPKSFFSWFFLLFLHYAYPKIIYHINNLVLSIFSLPTK